MNEGDPATGFQKTHTVVFPCNEKTLEEQVQEWLKDNENYIEFPLRRKEKCNLKHPMRIAYVERKDARKIVESI
jgi:hypothetical protein